MGQVWAEFEPLPRKWPQNRHSKGLTRRPQKTILTTTKSFKKVVAPKKLGRFRSGTGEGGLWRALPSVKISVEKALKDERWFSGATDQGQGLHARACDSRSDSRSMLSATRVVWLWGARGRGWVRKRHYYYSRGVFVSPRRGAAGTKRSREGPWSWNSSGKSGLFGPSRPNQWRHNLFVLLASWFSSRRQKFLLLLLAPRFSFRYYIYD